jgi:plasmid stabilization system protein ParE
MPERRAAKPLEWLASARAAYLETLEYIARENEHAARQVAQRVDRSLATIQTMPMIGTPTAAPGVRRYPIPNTGHVVNYRITSTRIILQRWYRARRDSRP